MKYAKLSAPIIKAIKPGEAVYGESLTVDRLASGDVRFKLALTVNKQRISRVVGLSSAGFTLDDARAVRDKLRTRAREETLNLPVGRKTAPTLAELAPEYLQRQRDEGAKNVNAKDEHLRLHLLPYFGTSPAGAIDAHQFGVYRKRRVAQKVAKRDRLTSHAQVNRELATLRHMLNKLVEWKTIPSHSLRARPVKESDSSRDALSIAQSTKLLEAAKRNLDPDIHSFVFIALNTSMRHGEILRIKIGDVDADRLRIRVPKAKAGFREQPMPPALAEHIAQRVALMKLKRTDWLFPSTTSKEKRRMSVATVFERVVVEAELADLHHKVTPHTLRHSAITSFARTGADIKIIQKMSGHKTLQMVMRYTHTTDAEIDLAMQRAQDRLLAEAPVDKPTTAAPAQNEQAALSH